MEANDIISSGLLEMYAAGLTSTEENLQVHQWVKQFPEVAAELLAIESGLESYAFANAVEPDAVVKAKLFQELNKKEATNKVINTGRVVNAFWKYAAAAAILLLVGSVVLNISYYKKYNEVDQGLIAAQQKLSEMKDDMEIVQSKYSMPVGLKSVKENLDAAAKIFWMQNTGDVYIDASALPDVPQGKQYQLWAIIDGKPVDAGMIATSKSGDKYRIQKMKTFGVTQVQAFAITLEKEGGSPTPDMDAMVVMKAL